MRCISLWQPWASAMTVMRPEGWIRAGEPLKRFETRDWAPSKDMIGERLAIAATKAEKPRGPDGKVVDLRAWWMENVKRKHGYAEAFAAAGFNDWTDLPFGKVVCHGMLARVEKGEDLRMRGETDAIEREWGNYDRGRFGWELRDLVVLKVPAPVVGRRGVFLWDTEGAERSTEREGANL